ncbi:MAG: endonuclease/exonuclease/phosphatase family protein [Pseudomonadota bacterium]
MRIASYNIQYGTGRDGVCDIKRIASEVEGADLIAFQEIDRFWPRTGESDQLAELQSLLSGYFVVYGAGVDIHHSSSKPDQHRRRQFGNAIFSRYPILSNRHHLLPKRGSIDPLSIQRSATEATVRCPAGDVRVYSVHLTHLSVETRLPQIDRLLEIHRSAVHEGAAVSGDVSGMNWEDGIVTQEVPHDTIMLGDFNCQPDSPEYLRMVGPLSDYGGHITPTDGFVDAWVKCGNDKNDGFTSDVNDLPARLDYAFVSSTIRERIQSCSVDTNAKGSDHLPLWLDIDL